MPDAVRGPGQIGTGWITRTNPEGYIYFQHGRRRIVTLTNVQVPSMEQWLLIAHDRLIELGRATWISKSPSSRSTCTLSLGAQ